MLRGRSYRRLGPDDRPALEGLLQRSVPGDYLLPMTADWLAGGVVLGGFQDAELIAVQRLDDLGEGEGWVGGIRVAPELRRQGIGRDLMAYTYAVVQNLGIRTLRLFIEEGNVASQHLARANGFSPVLPLAHLAGPVAPADPAVEVRPLPRDRLPDLSSCSWTRPYGGYLAPTVPEPFHMVRATESRLRREMEAGAAFSVPTLGSVFLLSPPHTVTWSDKPLRALTPISGGLEGILQGAAALSGNDPSLLDCFLPISTPELARAEALGLVRGALWGHTIGLYERNLD